MGRVEEFLQHFVEQPYDPVKAHEYYLKNRELKGRSTSGMSDAQKEQWTYSKDQISSDKKQKVAADKLANDQKIEAFQKTADETRKRISEKLKAYEEKLTKEADAERISIATKLKSDIANVAPIPKGVSGDQRAILVESRNKKIDDIRNAAGLNRNDLASNTKSSRQDISATVSGEREKTATDLKATITKTRDAYAKAKVELDANYETTYQKAYNKVITTIAGKPKTKGKGSKAKDANDFKPKDSNTIFYTKAEMAAKNHK